MRVGAVNYLNTKPLIYGLECGMMADTIELSSDFPANVAKSLLEGQIDLGLVPVAILPFMEEAHLVGSYGIAADGPVGSVAIYADCPIETIDTLLLDFQSRTSVQLAKLLLRDYWKINPTLVAATDPQYPLSIQGKTGGLVIGDRAFIQKEKSAYAYDLAEAWKQHTGLPFVFAAWVSNQPMRDAFVTAFDAANQFGLDHLEAVLKANPYTHYDLRHYYTRNIHYRLTPEKKAGLERFLQELKTL
jgi:chorismate dehydratase